MLMRDKTQVFLFRSFQRGKDDDDVVYCKKLCYASKTTFRFVSMKKNYVSKLQNGDGFISAKELGVLMRTLGRNPTEDEIMQIMNEIDVDHNGKLDFSEFTVMMRDKLANDDIELEIKQAFR